MQNRLECRTLGICVSIFSMRNLRNVLILIVLSAALILPGSRQSFSGMEWLQDNVISSVQDTRPDQITLTRHTGEEAEVLPGRMRSQYRERTHAGDSHPDIPFLPARITVFLPEISDACIYDTKAQFTVLFRSGGSFRRKLIPRGSSFIV